MEEDEVRIGGFRLAPGEEELLDSPKIRKVLEDPANRKYFDEEIWPLLHESYCKDSGTTASPVLLLEHMFLFGDGSPQMCFEPYSYADCIELAEKLHSRMIIASRSYPGFPGMRIYSFIGEENGDILTEPFLELPMIEDKDGLIRENPEWCPVKKFMADASKEHPVITRVYFALSYPSKDGFLQRSRLNTNLYEDPEYFCTHNWSHVFKECRKSVMRNPRSLVVNVPTYACLSSHCAVQKHKETYRISTVNLR